MPGLVNRVGETLIVSPWEFMEIQKQAAALDSAQFFKEDDIHGVWARAESQYVKFMVDNFGCKPYHSYKVVVDYSKADGLILQIHDAQVRGGDLV